MTSIPPSDTGNPNIGLQDATMFRVTARLPKSAKTDLSGLKSLSQPAAGYSQKFSGLIHHQRLSWISSVWQIRQTDKQQRLKEGLRQSQSCTVTLSLKPSALPTPCSSMPIKAKPSAKPAPVNTRANLCSINMICR